jgi:thiamine-phosphate pyrophosphorylase
MTAGLRTRAADLARAADRLHLHGGRAAPFRLAFMTDRRRIPAPEIIIRALPAGAAVILRDYDMAHRAGAARRLAALCSSRGLVFLVGGDPDLARAVGAAGVHLPARAIGRVSRGGGLLVSAACHDADELAAAAGADIALLSPVFPTASHPGAPALGPARFCALAASADMPVLALGGVDARNAARLPGPNVAGLAAIGAFIG